MGLIPESLARGVVDEFERRAGDRSKDELTQMGVGHPMYGPEEVLSALDALLDLRLSQGPRVLKFEERFAKYLGLNHAVAVNSGSSANLLAMGALINVGRLEPGDEILAPAATFATVTSPAYQLGLVPVYVDVSPEDWCIDPGEIEEALSPRTRLIMPVHNLGFPADMERIMALANERGVAVLEDCCESHGAELHGRKVGSFGLLSTLSFFVAHNITTGEGGMVFTDDDELEAALRSLREFGRLPDTGDRFYSDQRLQDYDARYIFTSLGYNVRMTDVAAALGLVQLAKLDDLNAQRREIVSRLREIVVASPHVNVPTVREGGVSAYYGFPMIVSKNAPFSRKELALHLEKYGIETRAMMGGCLPDQPGFVGQNHRVHGDLPVSRMLRDRALFIGCHPGITAKALEHMERVFKELPG